ncbi:MAG: biotin transporter BioY [Treponema sp.]|jgi:biotin transport system substrate-specific component|nr:biotin transporter BioY [Treponema sp.]
MEKTAYPSGTRKTIGRITLIALFAALIAAGTFVSIPLPFSPVPAVLQNLFTVLAGLCLGPVCGSLAVLLYLLAGALGAPVFAGATGGFTRFLGPTGGYLLGYLLTALVSGLIAGRPRSEKPVPFRRLIPAVVLGLLSQYIPGLFWLKQYTNLSWIEVFIAGALPFFLGDALKGIAAVNITLRLRRIIPELIP